MATLTSPARMPFGMVDDGRLKQLTNMKNKQNAISSPPSILSKRKATVDPYADDVDSENFDPALLSSPKKSKTSSGRASDFAQKPNNYFHLRTENTVSTPSLSSSRPIATPKRLSASKNIVDTTPRTAPAGRSPTRKRHGLLGNKRRTSAPFTRINPPAFSLSKSSSSRNGSSSGMPFSIDAALSGTVSSYTPTAASRAPAVTGYEQEVGSLKAPSKRASWFFEIHEDTPEQELGNLMEFSTATLDISDDEARAAKLQELEARGKENIPPELLGTAVAARPTVETAVATESKKDAMLDELRTPLGELEAKKFYAAGCDEQSSFMVPGDEDEGADAGEIKQNAVTVEPAEGQKEEEHDASPTERRSSNQEAWAEILARVDEQQKSLAAAGGPLPEVAVAVADGAVDADALLPYQVQLPASDDDAWAVEATSKDDTALFEIWESESAKEDDDVTEIL